MADQVSAFTDQVPGVAAEQDTDSMAVARLVVARWLAFGVTDVVLAPGSRSAPLALVLASAERAGQLALHVRIDERSAGFLALGLAKASGRIVPVVCTSGTAVANLAPAVVEAAYTGMPLMVVTADRPPRLRGVGANQTIDQVGFFGQQVRTAIDLVALQTDTRREQSRRETVDRVLLDAMGIGHDGPAPVHLNIAFDMPLVPRPDETLALGPVTIVDPSEVVRAGEVATDWSRPVREPITYAVGDIGLDRVPSRGLVVVGDVGGCDRQVLIDQAIDLATACGWPVVSEPSGCAMHGMTAVPAAAVALASDDFLQSHQPELVVTVGRFGISRSIMAVVAASKNHIAVQAGGKDRPDPLRTAQLCLQLVPEPPSDDPLIAPPVPDPTWLADWIRQGAVCHQQVVSAAREGFPSAESTGVASTESSPDLGTSEVVGLNGLGVSLACWEATGPTDLLFVAASRPVRFLEAAMAPRTFPTRVLGNRGASGIDGLVSTAWGIALSHGRVNPDGRTIALLGDLSFLHDHNGLLAPLVEARPNLTIVVADNNGGGIFSSLEQGDARFAAEFDRVFGTPQDVSIAAIARAVDVATTVVTSEEELAAALAERIAGLRVVVATCIDRTAEQRVWSSLFG